ncbi:MAG: uroporphyrinogen decarboxylase family protein [Candidatus Helarchaeota archaeon]
MSEKTPRGLFKERNQRVRDAIAIKEPDRVPITPMVTFYHTEQMGISKKEAMYNPEKQAQAAIEVFSQFNWDQVPPITQVYPAQYFDMLGTLFFKWPGAADEAHRLQDHQPYQFVEGEYMKASEYEDFFEDPTGFLLHKILPRHNKVFKGFSQFPSLINLASGYGAMLIGFPMFVMDPSGKELLETLLKGAQYMMNWLNVLNKYETTMKKRGFPLQFLNMAQAPYDVASEFLRGMRGIMLDMYRKPEELLKMLDLLVAPTIDATLRTSFLSPQHKVVFMPLHRGAEGFMNDKQFETFYWPTLTRVMDGLIEKGLIPMPFFEGKYTARFPNLAEYAKKHKGKLIYWFDQSDIVKGKDVFGDYACIRGNVPGSLLVTGSPNNVENYIKETIEGCAEGGGFIVDGGISGIPDEAKPENVKAMTDAVFKYGFYRK